MKSIIIAAPHSGSGKTTITIGIMEALRRRGVTVAPFKVGPDFIDPGYHREVTDRPSINLDGWICGPDFVRETFNRHTHSADIAIIEGAMGLFDGFGGDSEEGSTAQVAKLTGSSVILVVDARGQARSVAALVKGFDSFDPDVRLAGVIFNNVGSKNHAEILRKAIEKLDPNLPVIGCIPKVEELDIPSRHLGLVTAEDNPLSSAYLDRLAWLISDNLDLDKITNGITDKSQEETFDKHFERGDRIQARIAVAQDQAFCFVYEDNLRLLREAGADLIRFSPLKHHALPVEIDGVYLPGGYPELFSERLAQNESMKTSILEAAGNGMPIYAECGGFIYLTKGLTPEHPLVGLFPVTTKMLPRRKALGYREIEFNGDACIGRKGMTARGHEFHYSEISDMPEDIERLYRVRRGAVDLGLEGYRIYNCLASYIHLHFGSCPEIAAQFVEKCRTFKDKTANRE